MFPTTIPLRTALAGGGRQNATQLGADVNVLSVVATAGDSAILPPATQGVTVRVYNTGLQAAQIFGYQAGNNTDTVETQAAGIRQPANSCIDYYCAIQGNWIPEYQFTHNLLAVTDPVATNDNTQGFGPGSDWFNVLLSREWSCLSAATGAAVWSFDGCVPGVGVDPSGMLTQFGNCAITPALTPFAQFGEEGNLYRNIANPIAGNGTDTTDDILDGFVLPANAFDQAKRGLQLTFQGKFGATANNKRFKIWANPTIVGGSIVAGVNSGGSVSSVGAGALLFDSGVQTNNATGLAVLLQLFKYGVAGSNTQYSQAQPIFGTVHGGVSMPVFSTLVENAPINIVITGSSPTTGAAGDVVLNFSEVNAMN
ncbi:hypothetical protein [Solimicrobium silvestre]|uniref:Uncharacterized protein n=1 Tax=Solimicrobium silvestre TaxID=2099400 RepID=A0A2S9GY94_9BURK|nr:hypothetical protein [Solimicrobium silvestre]PRC92670.1 hypothetical protein S2091_2725 [Solimicrobium silvestre]